MEEIDVGLQRQANGTAATSLIDFVVPGRLIAGDYRISGRLLDQYNPHPIPPFYDRPYGDGEAAGGDDDALGFRFTLEQDSVLTFYLTSSGYYSQYGHKIADQSLIRFPAIFSQYQTQFADGLIQDNEDSFNHWKYFLSSLETEQFNLKAGDYLFWTLNRPASN